VYEINVKYKKRKALQYQLEAITLNYYEVNKFTFLRNCNWMIIKTVTFYSYRVLL